VHEEVEDDEDILEHVDERSRSPGTVLITARAFLIKRIDETISISCSDYELVGD